MRVLIGGIFCVATLCAQQYVITTVAGGAPVPTPVAATSGPLSQISGVTADDAGNVYFTGNNCVFKVNPYGVLTLGAGNSSPGYSGDGGPAAMAQFQFLGPTGVAVDKAGNVYIADTLNQVIRRVSATGFITTVAGSPGSVADGGPATNATIGDATALAVDVAGNLYISDVHNNVVRKVSTSN